LAEAAGGKPCDDHRQLIVESAGVGLDAVFVALPASEAPECVRLAARHGLAVLVVPPYARAFDTAEELAGLFPDQRPLIVARTWEHEPAYAALGDLPAIAGHVFVVHGHLVENVADAPEWLGNAQQAGGGVLSHGAYELVDAVVTLMGVPDAVFAAAGFAVPPGQARPYDTEDAASVVFRYSDDRIAGITCRRARLGGGWRLTLAGDQATVAVTEGSLRVTDTAGQVVTQAVVETANRFVPQVGSMATTLAAGTVPQSSRATDHRETLATLEAAYLSVRTGQPESPRGFLDLAGARPR
jgi:predicted dehydrogenase